MKTLAAILMALVLLSGCDWDDECDVVIRNYTDYDKFVYLNDVYQFRVVDWEIRRLRDVSEGTYLIEAFAESLRLYQAATFRIRDEGDDFYFLIEPISPVDDWGNPYDWESDIRVDNRTSYNLFIYLDDVFQFALDDYEEDFIDDVSTGYHLVEARRTDGGTFQANTILVESYLEDYEWVVWRQ